MLHIPAFPSLVGGYHQFLEDLMVEPILDPLILYIPRLRTIVRSGQTHSSPRTGTASTLTDASFLVEPSWGFETISNIWNLANLDAIYKVF